jgi:hypothetical protein
VTIRCSRQLSRDVAGLSSAGLQVCHSIYSMASRISKHGIGFSAEQRPVRHQCRAKQFRQARRAIYSTLYHSSWIGFSKTAVPVRHQYCAAGRLVIPSTPPFGHTIRPTPYHSSPNSYHTTWDRIQFRAVPRSPSVRRQAGSTYHLPSLPDP